jgi:hypothetical protein
MNKLAIICFVVALASCSSIRYVKYDMDRRVDFNRYKTYAWIPSPDVPYKDLRYDNHIVENNIKAFAADNIIKKSLRLSVDSPDLLFYYNLQIDKGAHLIQVPIYLHQSVVNI